jgi:hypothetical protein
MLQAGTGEVCVRRVAAMFFEEERARSTKWVNTGKPLANCTRSLEKRMPLNLLPKRKFSRRRTCVLHRSFSTSAARWHVSRMRLHFRATEARQPCDVGLELLLLELLLLQAPRLRLGVVRRTRAWSRSRPSAAGCAVGSCRSRYAGRRRGQPGRARCSSWTPSVCGRAPTPHAGPANGHAGHRGGGLLGRLRRAAEPGDSCAPRRVSSSGWTGAAGPALTPPRVGALRRSAPWPRGASRGA